MGADMSDDQLPLACVRGAISPDERAAHFQLIDRLFREPVREPLLMDDLPDGYEFQFEPNVLADLARFISNERLCCPFLVFNLRLAANGGPISLAMSGPAGTREFLDAELRGLP